ncbi:alpha/beta hydrolase [Corynebacterium massiliense]|uniref:alpha/beta hydrolase n=1 Tax=Corynebacterium massiliense TaxID=441501 RepID=UPI002356DAF7|nr:alpha/beta hydrolase-fold protein [Corynebacterium massiliense]
MEILSSLRDAVESIPLTGTGPTIVVVACLLISLAVTIHAGLSHPRRLGIVAGATAALTLLAWLVLTQWWKPFPDALPPALYAAGAVAIAALLAAAILPVKRTRLLTAGLISSLCAVAVANLVFQQYPDVRSLDPRPVSVEMTYDQFTKTHKAPTLNGEKVGALVTTNIDSPTSQFRHRPSIAYVPPAYFTQRTRTFPVIVLLAGNPGSPDQWVTGGGQMAETADDFQRSHDGVAPIVITVDATGTTTNNPICVDGPDDKVQTYLTQDVPQQLKAQFRVNADQHTWTIGGLSYGGTCALQVATNHPAAYGTFLDFSGQPEPTIGTRAQTVQRFFNGSDAAFAAVNPEDLLQHELTDKTGKYRQLAGRFVAGDADKEAVQALQHFQELTTATGMSTTYEEVPGGHSFAVWRRALQDTFDFAAARGGIQ